MCPYPYPQLCGFHKYTTQKADINIQVVSSIIKYFLIIDAYLKNRNEHRQCILPRKEGKN